MNDTAQRLASLLDLSHELGREDRGWAILGEGNTSARIDSEQFLVKASGCSLRTLREEDLVACRFKSVLKLLDKESVTDAEIESTLLASRIDRESKKPSVETLFHAYLLSLPAVEFVGHTHAVAVNQVLCSPRGKDFAARRVFPEEIVCYGPRLALVPYAAPGLMLAREIRKVVKAFIRKNHSVPRVILLKNHGLISLGRTPEAVLAAMLMAEKAAQVWVGAAALGGPTLLPPEQVKRIAGRQDEEVRRRLMNL
ncbi:MAG: class II aldolase [Ignavibacteria bacterium]|nr:class II aldolase [Ignavibacteria bacterium]